MPSETIKGGAYKTADGRWVNANGQPIPEPGPLPPLVDPSEQELSPLPVVTGSGEEFETPEAPIAPKASPSKGKAVTGKTGKTVGGDD